MFHRILHRTGSGYSDAESQKTILKKNLESDALEARVYPKKIKKIYIYIYIYNIKMSL